jgi:hypothetical protein
MGYFQDLFSVDGRLLIYSIFLVAAVMTIFELMFFYLKVIPDVNASLNEKFNLLEEQMMDLSDEKRLEVLSQLNLKFLNLSTNNVNNVNNVNNDLESIDNIFKVLIVRENQLIVFLFGLSILLFLVFLIIFTALSIKRDLGQGESIKFVEPSLVSIITIVLLIAFQVLFYYFGINYNYPKDNELLKTVLESIDLE